MATRAALLLARKAQRRLRVAKQHLA